MGVAASVSLGFASWSLLGLPRFQQMPTRQKWCWRADLGCAPASKYFKSCPAFPAPSLLRCGPWFFILLRLPFSRELPGTLCFHIFLEPHGPLISLSKDPISSWVCPTLRKLNVKDSTTPSKTHATPKRTQNWFFISLGQLSAWMPWILTSGGCK